MKLINKFKYKFMLLLALAYNGLSYGQLEGGDPPPPEGDGAPATPIDNYIFVLFIVALFVITYTYRRLKIKNI